MNLNLDKILYISGYIESTKKADHILEMPVKSFVVFCLDVEIGGQMNAVNYIKKQDDLQVVLLLSCLVGRPVCIFS